MGDDDHRQILSPQVAEQLGTLMVETVRSGTAKKWFRKRGRLAHVEIASKTGHLADRQGGVTRHYSWFVAYAPAERPEIAIASLVVNGEQWTTKGVVPARDVLEAWAKARRKATRTTQVAPGL